MSYNIETRSITEFVTDSKIKLPRFQRKSTWTAKQNFELAISIFQEYPVGVVIINDEGHTSWLLDGRQRRAALRDLRANPDLVYDWARKYIKFKSNQDIVELKNMFWDKIDAYLQQEEQEDEDSMLVAEPESAAPEEDYRGLKAKATHTLLKGISKSVEKNSDILWNFTKFLINRDGTLVKRYAPTTTPEDIEKDIQGML